MSVVSVRLLEEDEKWLRARGLKPGTFAREAVHEAIRRAELRESRDWLAQHSYKSEVDSTEFIRRERDSR